MVSCYTTFWIAILGIGGCSYGAGVLEILSSEVSKFILPNIFEDKFLTG